jgi:acyl carrier protein
VKPDTGEVREFLVSLLRERCDRLGIRDGEAIWNSGESLLAAGLVDSLGFVDLLTEAEAKFAVEVDLAGTPINSLATLDGLVRAVESARAK